MLSNFSSPTPLLPPWLDRSTLVNSDSDLDSGHCEASEVNSEIDSVMVPLFRVPLNDETCRRLNLVRSRSDASVVSTSNQLTSKEKLSLTRTMSNYETRLTVPSTNGHRESSGSPRLAHMKMTSYQQGDQLLNPGQLLPDVKKERLKYRVSLLLWPSFTFNEYRKKVPFSRTSWGKEFLVG